LKQSAQLLRATFLPPQFLDKPPIESRHTNQTIQASKIPVVGLAWLAWRQKGEVVSENILNLGGSYCRTGYVQTKKLLHFVAPSFCRFVTYVLPKIKKA
jgi:hypothetical protein